MSNKIGNATIANSILVSSFQNILPGNYGMPISSLRNNEQDLRSQTELPVMPSFAKWDNRDGRNGRRYWICKKSRKNEQQLLAKDLLVGSYSMSNALYTLFLLPMRTQCIPTSLTQIKTGP